MAESTFSVAAGTTSPEMLRLQQMKAGLEHGIYTGDDIVNLASQTDAYVTEMVEFIGTQVRGQVFTGKEQRHVQAITLEMTLAERQTMDKRTFKHLRHFQIGALATHYSSQGYATELTYVHYSESGFHIRGSESVFALDEQARLALDWSAPYLPNVSESSSLPKPVQL